MFVFYSASTAYSLLDIQDFLSIFAIFLSNTMKGWKCIWLYERWGTLYNAELDLDLDQVLIQVDGPHLLTRLAAWWHDGKSKITHKRGRKILNLYPFHGAILANKSNTNVYNAGLYTLTGFNEPNSGVTYYEFRGEHMLLDGELIHHSSLICKRRVWYRILLGLRLCAGGNNGRYSELWSSCTL